MDDACPCAYKTLCDGIVDTTRTEHAISLTETDVYGTDQVKVLWYLLVCDAVLLLWISMSGTAIV